MFETHVYGCPIRSDIPLLTTDHAMQPLRPGMQPLELVQLGRGQDSGKFQVDFKVPDSHGREIRIQSDRDSTHLFGGQPWALHIGDVLSFFGRGGEQRIYYQGTTEQLQKLLGFWFVHVVVPYALTVERGYCFLHASAVNLDNESVIFLAESKTGKSTLAKYFLKRGQSLVSDDKVAILKEQDEFLAVPSHPYYRPHRRNEDLGYHSDSFATSAKPVKAIYLLDRKNCKDIEFEPLSGAAAMTSLMTSCLSLFPVFWLDRLELLGDIARSVPVYRLHKPWGESYLGSVYEAIVEQL